MNPDIKVRLSLQTGDDPFESFECKTVDISYYENIAVVGCPELQAIVTKAMILLDKVEQQATRAMHVANQGGLAGGLEYDIDAELAEVRKFLGGRNTP